MAEAPRLNQAVLFETPVSIARYPGDRQSETGAHSGVSPDIDFNAAFGGPSDAPPSLIPPANALPDINTGSIRIATHVGFPHRRTLRSKLPAVALTG
ncbi:hypothetical protein [Paraburkholderia kururiensis]|uniref:hypothetical protein n=1 Tax=Paraburkholderia kururiensis TaxID=984307 RepID=UPI0018F54C54|nr:hypothetical protein [Paraburkholderia kururiensis]